MTDARLQLARSMIWRDFDGGPPQDVEALHRLEQHYLALLDPVSVRLPWPVSPLSPNARIHWARKAQLVKASRSTAFYLTREAFGPTKPNWPGARVSMTFCPPDKRRRDLDNCISSTKAARDGIADALGIDDSKFECGFAFGEPVPGGAVLVTIQSI
jgi:crossover junction endodeoxyribonuclease RusA